MAITAQRIWDSTRLILRDKTRTRYTAPRFCDALNAGMADFTNNVNYFVRTIFSEVPPNYQSIDFGDRANQILRVEYSDAEYHRTYLLPPAGYEKLDKEYPNWRSNLYSEYPRFVVVNHQNDCEFFVYPIARRDEAESVPVFGKINSLSDSITTTSIFGEIQALNVPYLRVIYAERQKPVVANEDGTIISFEGQTTPAEFEIQEDIMHCLKHYCAAIMLSDDNEESQASKAQSQLALYNRALEQVKEKKASGNHTGIHIGSYNDGFNYYEPGSDFYFGRGYRGYNR